ncbi:arginase [soil metagenome]
MVKRVTIIAPPCVEAGPLRQGRVSGLAKAAAALEQAGLFGRLESLGLHIDAIERPVLSEAETTGDPIADLGAYGGLIAAVVAWTIQSGSWPVLTGGSCNHLPGMIGGIQQALGATERLGLLWLDAHGDFNTPNTTLSGMLGGMPVAVCAGLCHAQWREGAGITAPLPASRILMIDVRNLDVAEEALIRATDVSIVRIENEGGLDMVLQRVREFVDSVNSVYVHIDADVLDAPLQPNHPSVEPDGLDVQQVLSIVEAAMESGKVAAFGVVSINPDEPGGDISLESGMELIAGGVSRWVSLDRGV